MKTWHSRIFLIFMLKVMVVYILKIGLNFYFGRNLVLRILGQTGPKMGPNEVFQVLSKINA